VSRLTGMNSEATRAKAASDIAITAPHAAGWAVLLSQAAEMVGFMIEQTGLMRDERRRRS